MYWKLVNQLHTFGMLTYQNSHDCSLLLSLNTCLLTVYSMVGTKLGAGHKGCIRHILVLVDFMQDPLGLMRGPFSKSFIFSGSWYFLLLIGWPPHTCGRNYMSPSAKYRGSHPGIRSHFSKVLKTLGLWISCLFCKISGPYLVSWHVRWGSFSILLCYPLGVLEFGFPVVLNSHCLSLQALDGGHDELSTGGTGKRSLELSSDPSYVALTLIDFSFLFCTTKNLRNFRDP